MESQVFGAGTIPGSPTTANEIKTLICLLLTHLVQPVTFEQLHEILLEERLVNYFELVQSLEQLVESEHLMVTLPDGIEQYQAAPLGAKTATDLYTSLPKSLRERTLHSGERVMAQHKRRQETKVEVIEQEDGFQVQLAIPDHGTDLLALSLFVPTQAEADRVCRRFLNDPVFLYKAIMALLQGDKDLLGDLLPQEESLF